MGQLNKTVVIGVALTMLTAGFAAGVETMNTTYTLSDMNSTATFTVAPDANNASALLGMNSWIVDDVQYIKQQWFWFRVGDTGPEFSLDTLDSTPVVGAFNLNDNDGNDTLYVRYDGADMQVKLLYRLTGGTEDSNKSDVTESITITNTSTKTMSLHFFQYCDFDLAGDVNDSSVQILGGNTARQEDVKLTKKSVLGECIEIPRANHYQVGTGSTLLDSLTDSTATTLTNDAGAMGPGDLSWAFEWDVTLRPGAKFLISKDKQITPGSNDVPEPMTLCLLTIGGIFLGVRRNRRRN